MKIGAIIFAALIGILLIGVFTIQGCQNTAIDREECVSTAQADVDAHLQRRVNLLTELSQCVKQYDKHEAETLEKVIAMRGKAMSDKEAKEVMFQIAAVAEKYPELQSQKNYANLMNECSITENLVAQHKKAFNSSVREYRSYCRSFPANAILKMLGYEFREFEYYKTDATDTKPLNLF